MGQNLEITKKLEAYIENLSKALHPIQKEIILYYEKAVTDEGEEQ